VLGGSSLNKNCQLLIMKIASFGVRRAHLSSCPYSTPPASPPPRAKCSRHLARYVGFVARALVACGRTAEDGRVSTGRGGLGITGDVGSPAAMTEKPRTHEITIVSNKFNLTLVPGPLSPRLKFF